MVPPLARLAAFLDCSAVVTALVSNLLSGALLVHPAGLHPLLEDLKRGSSFCSPAVSQTRKGSCGKGSLKTAKVLLVEVGWLLLVWLNCLTYFSQAARGGIPVSITSAVLGEG